MTKQEKAQRDRVIEAVFPVIADRMGWHHRIDDHPPRNTNFACDIADAAIAAMQPTPQEPRCVRCGHPKSNHPYRHPFVSIAHDAAMDRLVAEGQRCDAMTPQEAAKVLLNANAHTEKAATYAAAKEFPQMGFINAGAVIGAALRAISEDGQ